MKWFKRPIQINNGNHTDLVQCIAHFGIFLFRAQVLFFATIETGNVYSLHMNPLSFHYSLNCSFSLFLSFFLRFFSLFGAGLFSVRVY